jgi:hypothetical protein
VFYSFHLSKDLYVNISWAKQDWRASDAPGPLDGNPTVDATLTLKPTTTS